MDQGSKARLVATKQLKLAMDTGSKARLVATKRLKLAMDTDEKRKPRLEKMVATTQLRLALETGRKKSKKWIGFDLDLIWIGVLKIQ